MKKLFSLFILLLTLTSFAQNDSEKQVQLKLSGYVKYDLLYDTRQNVAIREGHFFLYPKNVYTDLGGEDINAKSNLNMLAIQTRFAGTITGPDAFGAKTSAYAEGEFFGHCDADINGFRLRHAFAKLTWDNTELLVGQYWHPMFITECFPGVASFNTGAPFQPFSRNPQIRLTQKFGDLKMVWAAMSQRDFASLGPDGCGSIYLRNNVVPELNMTIQYNNKQENGNEFLIGAGIDYMSLVPQLETDLGYATSESVSGVSAMSFLKYKSKDITFKLEGVLGQNTTNLTMLGGYAVKSNTNQSKGYVDYIATNTMALWSDLQTNGKKVQVGIFGGYTKNNGAGETVIGPFYSRGVDIDYVYRIAPRIMVNSGKMRFTGEIERTTAAYGTTQNDGTVANSEEVCNLRVAFGVYYFF